MYDSDVLYINILGDFALFKFCDITVIKVILLKIPILLISRIPYQKVNMKLFYSIEYRLHFIRLKNVSI